MGSIFTNKYAGATPASATTAAAIRDKVEQLAIDRAKELFARSTPTSGTLRHFRNVAVYMSTLQPGDTVLGMNLSHGGHLTHGHPLNFSGRMYNSSPTVCAKKTSASTTKK